MSLKRIESRRIAIRPFAEADVDDAVRLHAECFGPTPRDERERWLRWTVQNYDALDDLKQPPYGERAVVLNDGGEMIGAVGLVPCLAPFDRLPSFASRLRQPSAGAFTPEVGLFWMIGERHRRAGYAAEAAGALVKFAFEELHVERLVATTEHANAASIGVMRRLGMSIERNPDPEPWWFQTVGVIFNEPS